MDSEGDINELIVTSSTTGCDKQLILAFCDASDVSGIRLIHVLVWTGYHVLFLSDTCTVVLGKEYR